jgi:hypothetical protein
MTWRSLLPSAITLVLLNSCPASAQAVVALPDASRTTVMAAIVAEQYQVSAPKGATFHVARTAGRVSASPVAVSVTGITLPAASPPLRLLLMANAPRFTAPPGAAETWSAGDITWNAATWTNGTGSAGVLSDTAYTAVATADEDVASISTTGLTFTLAARPGVRVGGNQTLTATWKIECIGP